MNESGLSNIIGHHVSCFKCKKIPFLSKKILMYLVPFDCEYVFLCVSCMSKLTDKLGIDTKLELGNLMYQVESYRKKFVEFLDAK